MNQKPIRFVLLENEKIILNEEVIEIIKNSKNPRLILFYGSTRQGKSTTLNQLISGNIDSWKYINSSPFPSRTSQESVTQGCDIFGPISYNELVKKHNFNNEENIKKRLVKNDFDVFFCDTEGLYSLQQTTKLLIPGILTLLQVCTLSVIMIANSPNANDIEQITSELRISKYVEQINPSLKSPLISIYVSGYQIEYSDLDDENDIMSKYEEACEKTVKDILLKLNKDYPFLNVSENDFQVIPGGPYDRYNKKEPDHDNIRVKLYWKSINNIFNKSFYDACMVKNINNFTGEKLVSLIRIVFDIFQNFTELPNNVDLTVVLIKLISDSFEKYSIAQFQIIENMIKENVLINYDEYLEILNNENAAKKKIIECFGQNSYDIYEQLIPDKIQGFISTSIEKIRDLIKSELNKQINKLSDIICSSENINEKIKDKIELINKAAFLEDINMNEINDNYILNLWKKIFNENKKILTYYKEKTPSEFKNLQNNFVLKIKKIFDFLISKKKKWKEYLKQKEELIRVFINKEYNKNFINCKYIEDFEKIVNPPQIFFQKRFPSIFQQYFNISGMNNSRIEEVKKLFIEITEKEYRNLHKNKLPSWTKIYNNLVKKTQETLNSYLDKIMADKEFKEQIDPKLGTYKAFYEKIPNDIKQNNSEKRNEIQSMIEHQINEAIQLFSSKINKLPSFSDILEKKKNMCIIIIDDQMFENLSKFDYYEDKIVFNQDTIKSLLYNYTEIYENAWSKINEINSMISSISLQKAQEYDLLVEETKIKWKEIREERTNLIKIICDETYKDLFNNKQFQEEIGNLNINEIKNNIINTEGFNYNVYGNKKYELEKIIKNNLNELLTKYNNTKIKLPQWKTTINQYENTIIQLMENKVSSSLNNYEYKEDALNHKETSSSLFNYINSQPNFYKNLRNDKINAIKKLIIEYSKTYENIYLNESKLKKSRIEEERRKREEMERIKREEIERLKREEEERRKREEERRNNEVVEGSHWIFTGRAKTDSYGSAEGRYLENHQVYIVKVFKDGRPFPIRMGDNYTDKLGWANRNMLHH